MRWLLVLAALAALAAGAGGCASVTRGWTEQVQFKSEPSGAEVKLTLGHVCVTPCTLPLSRKEDFVAVFSKPGFETQRISVQTRLAGGGAAGFAGNLLLGGGGGMVVDAVSGATLDHCPNPVAAVLRPAVRGRQTPAAAEPVVPPECQFAVSEAAPKEE
jgi:hypothetical protein